MKILITGATGFLGGSLLERLLVHGERDIRCFVRAGSKLARINELVKKYPGATIELFNGTLGSPAGAAKALEGIDVVYHLAAALSGTAADMFLNTVVTSKNLLEAVVASGRPIKVVLVSSFGVYGVAELPRNHVLTEATPLEEHPERRDIYSQAKRRQERLFWDYQEKHHFPLVVLRPGVIYGPFGGSYSSRVGLDLMGVFLHLGRNNLLPLSYVENCAEAIVVAGQSEQANGQAYNVHDDDLPTCKQYLDLYKKNVKKIFSISVPYVALQAISSAVQRYNVFSKGQLPAIFTPYKTATSWKGNRFDNSKLKSLGWKQIVPTRDGLQRTITWLRENPKK